jgi:hypothetical protein
MGKRKSGVERMERSKRATGVNVGSLYRYGASIPELAETVIAAPSIESLIEEAKSGDRAAAKSVLALASAYLKTEIHGPLPLALRQYLGNALAKASLGESADVTLNLKRSGRPPQEHRTKLIIGHRIYKEMREGKSLEEASFECEEFLKINIRANGELYGYTKAPDSKTLEGIYSEVLPEIKAIYEEVVSLTSTLES